MCECIEAVGALRHQLNELDTTACETTRRKMFDQLDFFRFANPVIEKIKTTGPSAMRELEDAERDAADAANQLVEANQALVAAYAAEHAGQGVSLAELFEAGNIGLNKAVQKYEHQRGYKFSTYARWWINDEMARRIADRP